MRIFRKDTKKVCVELDIFKTEHPSCAPHDLYFLFNRECVHILITFFRRTVSLGVVNRIILGEA